jgi:hypothetical protein
MKYNRYHYRNKKGGRSKHIFNVTSYLFPVGFGGRAYVASSLHIYTLCFTGELSCFFVFLWIKTILHGRGKMCGCFIGSGLRRLTPLSTLFQLYRYIVAVSVIGGGNRNTRNSYLFPVGFGGRAYVASSLHIYTLCYLIVKKG